jgi:hypothetical protein
MQPSDNQPMYKASTLTPGEPGYRNRPGRTGLDPLENRQEAGRMFGLAIRSLFRRILRLFQNRP